MKHEPIDPVGARVTDVDLAALTGEEVDELRELLADRGVLVFPDQSIDDAGFTAFLKGFGELAFTAGEPTVPGFPDLNPVSNVGRETPPKSSWHVDTSYVSEPPAYTALRAVTIPAAGGETLFANQYRAHETLSTELRDALRGALITHVVSGVAPQDAGPETSARHPVFRPHPVTGRVALYLDAPARCAAVTGIPDPEAKDALISRLLEHSTAADNVYRHAWAPGDVVIWDNGAVLHRADHSGVVGDRVMHRGMVAAYEPADASVRAAKGEA